MESKNKQTKRDATREELATYMGKVRDLIQEGQTKGFVTQKDIEKFIPVEFWSADVLEDVVSNLMEMVWQSATTSNTIHKLLNGCFFVDVVDVIYLTCR